MDQTKYINTYIDVTMGTLHEYLSQMLQLKTQLKIANELLAEKEKTMVEQDRIIGEQNQIIAEVDAQNDTKTGENQTLQNEVTALRSKAAHMDACMKSVVDLKKEVQLRDAKILELERKLNPPKKPINRKKAKTEEPVKVEKPVDRLSDEEF
jgi:predicted RNase H-like nuclease (RuvC/YqgF family)